MRTMAAISSGSPRRPIGGGRLLVTQRDRARLTLVRRDGRKRDIAFPSRRLWVSGETGLMGLEVDPRFDRNRRVYTCSGWRKPGGGHDIRVIAWQLRDGLTRAVKRRVLVRIPNTHGRHGGCQLLVARNGALLVGTGDSAVGRYPQSLRTHAAKVLRLNRWTGRPWPQNPWADASGPRRNILTYGHRNVQGLAWDAQGIMYASEHGEEGNDEINLIRPGVNYGWPIEDCDAERFERPVVCFNPAVAPAGIAIAGSDSLGYQNDILLAALKAQQLRLVELPADTERNILTGYGRIRDVIEGPDGSLYVTTSNRDGRAIAEQGDDKILKVTNPQ